MTDESLKLGKRFIGTAFAWLVLDLATKFWATGTAFKPMVMMNDFFYLSLQKNPGIAFGIPLPMGIQVAGSIGIMAFLIIFFVKEGYQKKGWNQVLLGAIIGGSIGNLINRIHLGHVIDFIYLFPFQTFNIADIGITVGLTIFILYNWDGQKNKK